MPLSKQQRRDRLKCSTILLRMLKRHQDPRLVRQVAKARKRERRYRLRETARANVRENLEVIRHELHMGRISYGELADLQDAAVLHAIDPSDIELLEAAGVPEGDCGL